ncbi:MAG: hypothetical protein V3T31_11950, partial [candidate division Zixibacteria bacterium]
MMPIKVISNIHSLADVAGDGPDIDLYKYPKEMISLGQMLGVYFKSYSYDYFLLNCAPREIMIFGMFKLLFPFNSCKFVSMDLVLRAPETRRDRVIAAIRSLLFSRIALHFEYFTDTSGYQRFFGMKPDRFRYLPFKVNSYEQI